MELIADLHVHGKHARATSKNLNVENLEKYAKIKGVDVLGTGDFTHPEWITEVKSKLTEDGNGILRTASGFPFVLQTEISLVYTQGGRGRRVHHLILAPSIETVEQITQFLLTKGRVDYDGRPIFGMNSIELAEKLNEINSDCELIPAHAWTPWFGVFGSESGFNSLQECFEDKTKLIHSIETGMSSDPEMNWRISELDKITLTSNSDLHSFWPWRLGREANVFDVKKLTYKNVLAAIRERKGFVETIEVDPGYGKYHLDGHRNCGIVMTPAESAKVKKICPKCKKPLTIGVLNRVEELADREPGFTPKNAIPFRKLIPLSELIAAVIKSPVNSKKAWSEYDKLIQAFGNEMCVLTKTDERELMKIATQPLANAIMKNRNGKIEIEHGFDGVYGKPVMSSENDSKKQTAKPPEQRNLSSF